jgi:hypothetical protein
MDQDQLRAILRTIIADRAQAGESLADVGRMLAQVINPSARLNGRGVNPTRPPFSRQYVHMLANGKTRITEEIGARRSQHSPPCKQASPGSRRAPP